MAPTASEACFANSLLLILSVMILLKKLFALFWRCFLLLYFIPKSDAKNNRNN